ncbi:hypothetical protein METBIDRAFT_45036 [Metschnikowia bicuspidata var. bicuspidata NRRL YB-4993]|uniref:Uncharacterized protein n=1 Tax=Metschnikowia bicuspidata var. bicuspidata NRRL YB-4993 TaxID=869754 RepID=A0A1A0H7J9_9ASCO|nr:hypothetical protein METBIDRAFT_45036 [Metschnikowia bicuspidata var. bicuspidata NRRL YB-4993]OBA19955.1 hypothetical protein METBIDRAFT_45036 [Metschnikowia bicuspidata var. bicuspidata NRRL YB-4993]
MANFGFVKCSRRERLKFFQSSLPYLNNHALVLSANGEARRWALEEPHPTNQSFLTFKNGHYGIYFTLFNHELRKEEHDNTHFSPQKIIIIVRDSTPQEFVPEFFISKAKQDIHNDITWLKTVTRNLLSTASLVKLKCSVKQLCHIRSFSTSAFQAKDKTALKNSPDAHESGEYSEPFEEGFARTQIAQIMQAYENYSSPDDLNIIYPLYQSLKRNGILLPSIDEYNIILKSIVMRALDSEDTLSATESRLTCLLTVYQDVLIACQSTPTCHPNRETYQIVLRSIFDGSRKILTLVTRSKLPRHTYHQQISKVLEFCKVGVDLYASLLHDLEICKSDILPNVLYCLKHFPGLFNERLATFFLQLKDHTLSDALFYIGLIALVEYLRKFPSLGLDKKASYKFMSDVFDTFKHQCETLVQLSMAEYSIYSAMLQGLVACENLPIATKFLDDIILSYKDELYKNLETNTVAISDLISDYLLAVMKLNSVQHLDKAHTLLLNMRQVPYLPDLNVTVFHDMISRYIAEYVMMEQMKVQKKDSNDMSQIQQEIYHKIWDLYNYIAIRKDFLTSDVTQSNSMEMLLSISIDLADSQKVSRLIKEILVKRISIEDWSVLRKLCYMLSTEAGNGGSQHYEVMWAILENQATHFTNDSVHLNDFLSELVSYILLDSPKTFDRIMNLTFISNAFESCSLQDDNFYGLTTLMLFLQNKLLNCELTVVERAKILTYQAHMINEFEDTENHYLDLPGELREFNASLKNSFTKAFNIYSETQYLTESICQACSKLGIEVADMNMRLLDPALYEMDLTPLFSISYKEGLSLFVKSFKEGFNFNDETWRVIINRSFVLDVLEPGKIFKTSDFIKRLLQVRSDAQIIQHLASLISLNNEKVNIEIFKFLSAPQYEPILASSLLNCMAEFAKITKNHYFLTLFIKEFERLANINPCNSWKATLFEKLNQVGRNLEIYAIVSQNFDLLNKGLDVRVSTDVRFLKEILIAYMKSDKEEQINHIFNLHFAGAAGQKLLLKSNELLACLLGYYISIGSYEMVVKKFGKLADRSTDLKQSVQFSNLLSSLNGSHEVYACAHDDNRESFALALLNEEDLLGMKRLYLENLHLVGNKEIFFNILVSDLTKAALSLKGMHQKKLTTKFEAIIKFCKVLELERISAGTLNNMVNFLIITKSKDLLNIAFNKFLVNNSFVSSFNFYFLRVELQSERELIEVLKNFEAGFRKTNDLLNLHTLEAYKAKVYCT